MSSLQKPPHPSPGPSGSPHLQKKQMFPNDHQWRDLWVAIVFYAQLALLLAAFVYTGSKTGFTISMAGYLMSGEGYSILGIQVLVMLVISGSLAFIAKKMLRQQTALMIKASLMSNIVLSVLAISAILFLSPDWIGAVACAIMLIFVGFHLYTYFSQKAAIPLLTMLLKAVIDYAEPYPSVYWILVGSLGWVILCTVLASWTALSFAILYYARPIEMYVGTFFCVLSFLWTAQVIKNVCQTTIAGIFATHYFLSQDQRGDGVVMRVFRRTITYSFGSVCLGSVGASFSVLYTFTQIAIYGKPFSQASSDARRVLQRHGIHGDVKGDLIGAVTRMLACAIAICCGIVSFVLSSWMHSSVYILFRFLLAIGIGFLGYLVPYVTFSTISFGSTALLGCIFEDSSVLRQKDPQLYEALVGESGPFAAV